MLKRGETQGLESLLRGIDQGAVLKPVEGAKMMRDISLDADATGEVPLPVQVAKGTVLYQTQLEDRIPLLKGI